MWKLPEQTSRTRARGNPSRARGNVYRARQGRSADRSNDGWGTDLGGDSNPWTGETREAAPARRFPSDLGATPGDPGRDRGSVPEVRGARRFPEVSGSHVEAPTPRRGAVGREDDEAIGGVVTLVGATEDVRNAVAPVVAGAGMVLDTSAAQDRLYGTSTVGPDGNAGTVLWSAGTPGQPPPDSVLVGTDEETVWKQASRYPQLRCVVLPQGNAWLAEHLAGHQRLGRVLTVAGLGDGACPDRVALLVAMAALEAGLDVVVVDLHGRGELAALAARSGDFTWAETEDGSGGGSGVGGGGLAGWREAVQWCADGTAPGLVGALPRIEDIPVLLGDIGSNGEVVTREDAAAVLTGLARGTDLVVAALGAARPGAWRREGHDLGGIHESILVLGRGPLPGDSGHLIGSAPVSLVTARSGFTVEDGRDVAAALGVAWAGDVDVRRTKVKPVTRRLLSRVWAPRLAAGIPLGRRP